MADHTSINMGNPWGECPECGYRLEKQDIAFAIDYYYSNSPLSQPNDMRLGECGGCGKPLQVTVLVHGRNER